MLEPSGECFPSSFTFFCFLDSSFFVCMSVGQRILCGQKIFNLGSIHLDTGAVLCITPSESLQNVGGKKVALEAARNKGVIKCKNSTLLLHLSRRPKPCDSGVGAADGQVWTAWEAIRNPWERGFQGAAWHRRGHYWQHRAQGNRLCSHKITFTFPGRDWHCSKQAQTGKGTW